MTRKSPAARSRPVPGSAGEPAPRLLDLRHDPARAVAFARALAGEGETRRALDVLAEITWIHPLAREAWALRGILALAVADVSLAAACSIHCAAAMFHAGRGAVADFRRPAARA